MAMRTLSYKLFRLSYHSAHKWVLLRNCFTGKAYHSDTCQRQTRVLLVSEALSGQWTAAYACKNYLLISIWRHGLLPLPQTQMIEAEQFQSQNYLACCHYCLLGVLLLTAYVMDVNLTSQTH